LPRRTGRRGARHCQSPSSSSVSAAACSLLRLLGRFFFLSYLSVFLFKSPCAAALIPLFLFRIKVLIIGCV
jgi:hypothetical protein